MKQTTKNSMISAVSLSASQSRHAQQASQLDKANAGQKHNQQFFDDSISQVSKNTNILAHRSGSQIRDSSASERVAPAEGKLSQAAQNRQRNEVNTRLTPGSSYGGPGSRGHPMAILGGSSDKNESSSFKQRQDKLQHSSARRGNEGTSVGGGSLARQTRLSARHNQNKRDSATHEREVDERTMLSSKMASPNQTSNSSHIAPSVSKTSHQQLRKSPSLQTKQQIAVAALYNETSTISARGFNVDKQSEKRHRNARTFVEEDESSKDTRQQIDKSQIQQNQNFNRQTAVASNNRSILSNGQPTEDENLSARAGSIGTRMNGKPRGQAQLQALAELRQRENHTVQTGQMITARQRNRDGYLEPPQSRIYNGAKSTQGAVAHDEDPTLISQGTSDNLRLIRQSQDNNVKFDMAAENQTTELRVNSGSIDHNDSIRNFSKGTFERQMADSIEESNDQSKAAFKNGFKDQVASSSLQKHEQRRDQRQYLQLSREDRHQQEGEGQDEEDEEEEGAEDLLSRSQSGASDNGGVDSAAASDYDHDDAGYYGQEAQHVESEEGRNEQFYDDGDRDYYGDDQSSNRGGSHLARRHRRQIDGATKYAADEDEEHEPLSHSQRDFSGKYGDEIRDERYGSEDDSDCEYGDEHDDDVYYSSDDQADSDSYNLAAARRQKQVSHQQPNNKHHRLGARKAPIGRVGQQKIRRSLDYSASSEEQIEADQRSHKRREHRLPPSRKHDSQRRVSAALFHRQRSPTDIRSHYSQKHAQQQLQSQAKRHQNNNSSHNQSVHRVAERAYKRQVTGVTSHSKRSGANGQARNSGSALNEGNLANSRKQARNQPLKININMTGGSQGYSNQSHNMTHPDQSQQQHQYNALQQQQQMLHQQSQHLAAAAGHAQLPAHVHHAPQYMQSHQQQHQAPGAFMFYPPPQSQQAYSGSFAGLPHTAQMYQHPLAGHAHLQTPVSMLSPSMAGVGGFNNQQQQPSPMLSQPAMYSQGQNAIGQSQMVNNDMTVPNPSQRESIQLRQPAWLSRQATAADNASNGQTLQQVPQPVSATTMQTGTIDTNEGDGTLLTTSARQNNERGVDGDSSAGRGAQQVRGDQEEEEVNMDELWKRLRAANDEKPTTVAKTAPSVQVKKPYDPSPNLIEEQEAELVGGRQEATRIAWAQDRSQTQEFTLNEPVVERQDEADKAPGADNISDQGCGDQPVAFPVKKKAQAIIIGFDDDKAVQSEKLNPFANRPVLRSQRATSEMASGGGQPGRLHSKNNTSQKTFGIKKMTSDLSKKKHDAGARPGDDKSEDNAANAMPLGSDFKKVSIEQIKAREERLKKIKDQGLIEIFDDDVINGQQTVHNKGNQAAQSIAEAFAAKRRAGKHQDAFKGQQPLDQDLAVARDASCANENSQKPPIAMKPQRVAKTPQELAQIRKAMMKKRHNTIDSNLAQPSNVPISAVATPASSVTGGTVSTVGAPISSSSASTVTKHQSSNDRVSARAQNNKTPTVKEPNAALMERLAGGKRTQIDKKEMKKLTRTNYENLPEIKRRKDEERKRQEALEKKERIAKYNKECKARSRAQLKKKREMAAERGAMQTSSNVPVIASEEEKNITSVPQAAITLTAVTQKSTSMSKKQL